MSWLGRLKNALRAGKLEREIRRELEFHAAERADELRASGLSPDEAARQARARLGNPLLQAERTRDVDVALWADGILRNLHHALRRLGHAPGFALTVVATLALGIGANTAVFSALDAVLLRPLPFPQADRLVRLTQKQAESSETSIAPVRLQDWNRLSSTFRVISGYFVEDVSETSGDLPERVRRAFVTPRILEAFGVSPAQGRGFRDEEHRFGGPRAALISDRYWRARLGSSPDVLSRSVRIGGAAVPIVGVMPASFRFPDREVDLWFPSPVDAKYAQSRHSTWYQRRRAAAPGRDAGAGARGPRRRAGAARRAVPRPRPQDRRRALAAQEQAVGGVGHSLWLLFGAVSVLLLIACTNIVALFLARGASRRQEIALRLSLGASRLGDRRAGPGRDAAARRRGRGARAADRGRSRRRRCARSEPSCRASTRSSWTAGSSRTARRARSAWRSSAGCCPRSGAAGGSGRRRGRVGAHPGEPCASRCSGPS
jgi:hypothetical protein